MSTIDEQVEEQIEQFQRKIRENPNDIVAHYNLGDTLQGVGRKDEAIAEYRKALELDTKRAYSAIVNYNLGTLYYGEKRLDEAIAQFGQSIEDLPKLRAKKDVKSDVAATAHYCLGCVLFEKTQQKEHYGNEQGDLDRAEENFRKALEFDPNFSSAQKNLEIVRRMIRYGWSVKDESDVVLKVFAGNGDQFS